MKKIISIYLFLLSLFLSCNVLSDVYNERWHMMVFVPGGTFQRDATSTNLSTVSAFYMSEKEITQAQYVAVTGASNPSWNVTPNVVANNTNRPVDQVTWYDAVEFCNDLSTFEGLTPVYAITRINPLGTGHPILDATVTAAWTNNGYRLPTEMEWMYAAMGGSSDSIAADISGGINIAGYNKAFAGSNGSNAIGNYAWYSVNSSSLGSSSPDYGTHPVGTRLPNELGLYDMSGNVWEWCWDQWDGLAAYPPGLLTDYFSSSGTFRVLRGGGWTYAASDATVAVRGNTNPNVQFNVFGFRVVRR